MNENVRQFFLIFCIIGVIVGVVLAIVNGSKHPASGAGVAIFTVVAIVMAAGTFAFRKKHEL